MFAETARAYKDAKQGEHAIVYLQEAHQACDEEHARVLAEMLREQQQQKRKKCQMLDSLECIRREIQLHEVRAICLLHCPTLYCVTWDHIPLHHMLMHRNIDQRKNDSAHAWARS